MFSLKFKKGIIAIVTVSLLMLVSIIIFLSVYGWFDEPKSKIEELISQKDFNTNIAISKINGTNIILKNNFLERLVVESIIIGGSQCLIDEVIVDEGLNNINIFNCTKGLEEFKLYTIAINTNYGTKFEKKIIQNPLSS
ncbi:MAG: hypothetical protein ACOC16_03575 [Nanoarchaeota archaeon]